ncbi:WXG100 family type VII secretion target [Actinocrispum sp. NPDC049592]|uniref:WXG100 family type VII secretion target n=1 Tax=Actinocrispum sp. NPDC049592 TaxID=3154835 RepID=UPI00341DB7D9
MPVGYEVKAEDLHKASVDTDTIKGHTQGHINHLRGQLQTVESAWRGDAATAFQQLFERFNTAANKLLNDLGVISESLGTAAKNYGHQEEETKSSANKISGNFSF